MKLNYVRINNFSMCKYYIIDIIGKHSGMHYYDYAFVNLLEENNIESRIISNFHSVHACKLPNFYRGTFIVKLIKLLAFTLRLMWILFQNRKVTYVYLSFGSKLDLLFLSILILFRNKFIVDIHEFVMLDVKNNTLSKCFSYIYKNKVGRVIYHSDKIRCKLVDIQFNGKMIYVPHFKYDYDKKYFINNVGKDVLNIDFKSHISFLFFGHIRPSKGIDILLETVKDIDIDNVQFIIAGNDPDNLLDSAEFYKNLVAIRRYINNDELNFLFSKVDYVLLPYREISQSGVLETAIYFRKPVILSDLKYFRDYLSKYSSFGVQFSLSKKGALTSLIYNMIGNDYQFYSSEDLELYNNKDLLFNFVNSLVFED